MDPFSFAPLASLLFAVYSAVSGFADLIEPAVGGASAALAIAALTVVVRLALIPVSVSQVKAEIVRRRLAPELARLRRRYASNPELLQRKTMELYKSEGASPFAGMLPTLAQAPVVSIVYALFVHPMIAGHANVLLSASVLGAPLGSSFVSTIGAALASSSPLSGLSPLAVFVALILVIAVVAALSRRTALRMAEPIVMTPAATSTPGPKLTAALSWTPFLIVVFAAIVPLAATIYLTVTTIWTFVERALIRRRLAVFG